MSEEARYSDETKTTMKIGEEEYRQSITGLWHSDDGKTATPDSGFDFVKDDEGKVHKVYPSS